MTDPRWTPEVEELVARAGLVVDSGQAWVSAHPDTQAMYRGRAAVILTALADGGHLARPNTIHITFEDDAGARDREQLTRLVAAAKRVLGLAAHNNLIGSMQALTDLREALPPDQSDTP